MWNSGRMESTANHEGASVEYQNGLYDSFESYRPPSNAAIEHVFAEGIVAFDANVLIDLYRYTEQARADLLAAMDGLGRSLWVPHQALEEFWRSRERVLDDPRETQIAIAELEKVEQDALQRFSTWANSVSLPGPERAHVEREVRRGFQVATEAIEGTADDEATIAAVRDHEADPVLRGLRPRLAGRVGPPLDPATYARALDAAERRAEAGIPPGFRDRKKAGRGGREQAAGDYLVWEQLLLEVERRDVDALLVTGDVKDDWWRKERGMARGPRVELAREMTARTGRTLFMLTPAWFLDAARRLLGVTVHDESVRSAEHVSDQAAIEEIDEEQLARYWSDYLSDNGRRFYRAAANVELYSGPGFTFDDISRNLSITTESARSFHRNSGRSARVWRDETDTAEPIRLDWMTYAHDAALDGMRTSYRLPPGVAEAIRRIVP